MSVIGNGPIGLLEGNDGMETGDRGLDSGTSELRSSELRSLDIHSSDNSNGSNQLRVGLEGDGEDIKTQGEFVMEGFLGTIWFSLLLAAIGYMGGCLFPLSKVRDKFIK